MQSIWMREGFPIWYDHIYSFLAKVEARWKSSSQAQFIMISQFIKETEGIRVVYK